jgi:hypothetical protein
MIRLTDLHPRWVTPVRFSVQIPTGISFDCPCCRSSRLSVNFRNPIDPEGLLAKTAWQASEPAWERSGTSFENLSLLPSIDFTASGHWHGHLMNGEVSNG